MKVRTVYIIRMLASAGPHAYLMRAFDGPDGATTTPDPEKARWFHTHGDATAKLDASGGKGKAEVVPHRKAFL